MAKLSADGASAVPEDSASHIDSGPFLLLANGEAASGMSARGVEATGRGVPIPSAVKLGAGCTRANAAGDPMTVSKLKHPRNREDCLVIKHSSLLLHNRL